VRYHIRVGQVLPLHAGSPGKVILAFIGTPGQEFDDIRRAGYYVSVGERDPEVAAVSAPVYGLDWKLLGAISISGPASRMTHSRLDDLADAVIAKANSLSVALGGRRAFRMN
jgi:DNA-binding IclR family transcriptional regulator